MPDERKCRICGCTDHRSCCVGSGIPRHAPCHWVADDLCSTCAPVAAIEAFLPAFPLRIRGHLAEAVEQFRTMLGRRD